MNKLIGILLITVISLRLDAQCEFNQPVDNAEISDDVSFIIKWGDNIGLSLEISRSMDFEDPYIVTSRYMEREGYSEFPILIEQLVDGVNYWRIVKDGTYSDVKRLFVTGACIDSMEKDPSDYELQILDNDGSVYMLTPRWLKTSVSKEPFSLDKERYKNIATHNGLIYMPKLSYSMSDDVEMSCYDAATGDYKGIVCVSGKKYADHSSNAFSMIGEDNNGNMFLGNNGAIVISSSGKIMAEEPVVIYCLDMDDTMNPKIIKEYVCDFIDRYPSKSVYFSSLGITGDLGVGTFQVISISYSYSNIPAIFYRWQFVNGELTETESVSWDDFFIAPRIVMIDDNHFIVTDESDGMPRLFSWIGAKLVLVDELTIPSVGRNGGSCRYFIHDGKKFLLYAANAETGVTYKMVECPYLPETLSGTTELWKFPKNGLTGEVYQKFENSIDCYVSQVIQGNGSPITEIYLYAQGKGLASYSLTNAFFSSVEPVISSMDGKWRLYGDKLKCPEGNGYITIYNTYGVNVATLMVNDDLFVYLSEIKPGLYIAVGDNNSRFKFVL